MIGRLTDEQFKAMWYGRISSERICAQAKVSREAMTAHAEHLGLPRRPVGSVQPPQTQEARIEGDVEYILHEIMQRRNYTAATRDSLHVAIEKIIEREIKAFCKPKRRAA